MHPLVVSDYLHPVFTDLEKVVNSSVKTIPKNWDFNTIAFRGMSGALVAPAIAIKMDKKIILVRKPKEEDSSHSIYRTEGYLSDATRYIIVDDFVDSGKTILETIDGVNEFYRINSSGFGNKPVLVGILLYSATSFRFWSEYYERVKDIPFVFSDVNNGSKAAFKYQMFKDGYGADSRAKQRASTL